MVRDFFNMCIYNMQELYPGNWHIHHLTHYQLLVLGTVKIFPTILKHTINCCQSQLLCCAANMKVILPIELFLVPSASHSYGIKESPHNKTFNILRKTLASCGAHSQTASWPRVWRLYL